MSAVAAGKGHATPHGDCPCQGPLIRDAAGIGVAAAAASLSCVRGWDNTEPPDPVAGGTVSRCAERRSRGLAWKPAGLNQQPDLILTLSRQAVPRRGAGRAARAGSRRAATSAPPWPPLPGGSGADPRQGGDQAAAAQFVPEFAGQDVTLLAPQTAQVAEQHQRPQHDRQTDQQLQAELEHGDREAAMAALARARNASLEMARRSCPADHARSPFAGA